VCVIGDVSQLHQSFINLILNARDAMPEGGRIGVGIDLVPEASRFDFGAIEHPERYAHFFVEDSGHGMTPETLRHIFEPLFTTKKNGTGLGLPVARHVVTRHGGEIFVESAIGSGTKFHLFIPIAANKSGATAAPIVPAAQELSLLQKVSRAYRRVLVVEDERPVASGIVALLELEGVDAMIVETGREVLPAIGHWNPDAVILDIGLPDIDGTKVYAAIARKYPALPVVFSSGHGDESQLEEFLARRNVAFLLKPYDVDTLLSTLDRVVS
jgi:two-component system cell cycle sensor histidine kinase/response regulator CckA